MIATPKRRPSIRQRLGELARVAPGFVVAERPVLTAPAAFDDDVPSALVVFVDGVHARLIPFSAQNGEEVTLQHDVEGRHRQGGWARLAQSRYQLHIEHERAQHFGAVAEALNTVVTEHGVERIVLAGEKRAVAGLVARLPRAVTRRVAGTISADRHEPAAALLDRSRHLLAGAERAREAEEVAALLTDAAKGGGVAIGLTAVLEAVSRGAVRRLYLMKGFDPTGRTCAGCAALRKGGDEPCHVCGASMNPVQLGEALVERVIAAGGDVHIVDETAGVSIGGVAARLRYAYGARR